MVDTVIELAGVSREVAEKALAEHKEIWLAVDSLLERPSVAGDKFMPKKRKAEHVLSEEQEARCKRGRWLQDQVNAVFSVAHSKIRNQQDPSAPEEPQKVPDEKKTSAEMPSVSEQ